MNWRFWRQQTAAVLRLELAGSFLNRRSWWIYLLALAPIALTWGHSIARMVKVGGRCSLSEDVLIFAGMYQFYYLRLAVFFGCVGIFSNLFRNEILNKTLHYYLLTPMRREVLVAGKYLAGLVAAVVVFTLSVACSYIGIGFHFGEGWKEFMFQGAGMGQLGWYMLTTALAVGGYGAVFLLMGQWFRNPMIPAAVVMVWEAINNFLPAALKKVSVIFYLKSLLPVDVPMRGPFAMIAVAADPVPAWVGIPGVLLVSAAILGYCAWRSRTLEISYTD
jgi:ABC-type transport system involved in multi-copper enzyme maturation permease subunit